MLNAICRAKSQAWRSGGCRRVDDPDEASCDHHAVLLLVMPQPVPGGQFQCPHVVPAEGGGCSRATPPTASSDGCAVTAHTGGLDSAGDVGHALPGNPYIPRDSDARWLRCHAVGQPALIGDPARAPRSDAFRVRHPRSVRSRYVRRGRAAAGSGSPNTVRNRSDRPSVWRQ